MNPEIDPKSQILLIGRCRYDLSSGKLTTGEGTPLHLRRQSSEVLAELAANTGEVVARDDLVEAVWKDVATTDDSLIQCIADIRRAVGKEAVETFPKIGYRLVASREIRSERKAGSAMVAIFALIAIAASAIGVWQVTSPDEIPDTQVRIDPPRIIPEKTLAVLPFVNLGGAPDQRYFGDGLSEDLTTDLAKIPDLTVIAFASSGDFPQAEAGFSEIASDLGVRYLVRGTVRHSGDRVRINVALIDPQQGVNIWAERFDRIRQDPFEIQEDVTQAIVDALSLELEAEIAPSRVSPDAYFMLLRGLEPLREGTLAGNQRAREFFERALELDPNYARAHAYMAVAHGRDVMFNYTNQRNGDAVAKGPGSGHHRDPARPGAAQRLFRPWCPQSRDQRT